MLQYDFEVQLKGMYAINAMALMDIEIEEEAFLEETIGIHDQMWAIFMGYAEEPRWRE